MSETTKPAAPGQAAEEKEKAAPVAAPSLDPAPIANSKGDEPYAEAFRVSTASPHGQRHGWGMRGGSSISGAVGRRRLQVSQGEGPSESRRGVQMMLSLPAVFLLGSRSAGAGFGGAFAGLLQEGGMFWCPLAGMAHWGLQALQCSLLGHAVGCCHLLPPVALHGWGPCSDGGVEEESVGDRATQGSMPQKCCSRAGDKG